MRILLIEDDISLCNALMIHLRSEGYETDVCHNGTDGLSYALQNTYDVIILDRMLPELDGLTLLSAIRRKNIFTPVIIATAMDSLQEKIIGLRRGRLYHQTVRCTGTSRKDPGSFQTSRSSE